MSCHSDIFVIFRGLVELFSQYQGDFFELSESYNGLYRKGKNPKGLGRMALIAIITGIIYEYNCIPSL